MFTENISELHCAATVFTSYKIFTVYSHMFVVGLNLPTSTNHDNEYLQPYKYIE